MDRESPAVRARRQTMKLHHRFAGAMLVGSLIAAPVSLMAADQLQTRDRLHTQDQTAVQLQTRDQLHTQDQTAVQLQTRDRLHTQDQAAVQLQTRDRLHAQDRATAPKMDRAQKRNRAR